MELYGNRPKPSQPSLPEQRYQRKLFAARLLEGITQRFCCV